MNSTQEFPTSTDDHSKRVENKPSPKLKCPSEEMKALYLLPLRDGWTREIRLRRNRFKRRADVYYRNPEGLRFRSRLEIMKHLEKYSITTYDMSHFSFYPEPFGGECAPYEVVVFAQPNFRSICGDAQKLNIISPSKTEEVQEPLNVQRVPRNPFDPIHFLDPDLKVYCICTDVEWGKMVRCCNEGCLLQLYHAACIRDEPEDYQLWYCPICRDSDSSTLNPAYAIQLT